MPELDPEVYGGLNASTPAQGDDEVYGGFDAGPAQRIAVGSAGASPDQAAKSIALSKETGVPARVIHADPEGFTTQKRAAEASHYIQTNPHIAGFIGSYPLGAEVAVDDYDNMDKISKTGTELNSHPVLKNIIDAIGEGFGPLQPNVSLLDPRGLSQFTDIAMKVMNAGLYGGGAALEELLRAGGVGDTTASRIKREAINFVGFLGAESMGKGGEGLSKKAYEVNLNAAERAHILAGETPPPGTGQVTDHVHNIQAHVDAASMDKMVEVVEASKMKERSPPALEAYLDRVLGDREVSISAEKVQELYKDKAPGPDDGVLNIRPEQLDLAHAAGSDVNIKLSKLLAELDPAQYGEMRDSIRFRKEGVTLEEAKELDLEPKEIKEGETPEKPPTVRDQVKKSFYFQPLFENAKAVGMDEVQYKKYFDRFNEANDKDIQRKLTREELIAKQRLAPEWKTAEKSIREDVTNEFQGLDLINQAFNGAMPKTEMAGRIDAEVQARLEAKFGGNLSNLVLDEARDSALAGHYVDLMIDEYNSIKRNLPEGQPISIEDVKKWVKESSSPAMKASDLDYETFRRSAEKGYKEAAKAATAGKWNEALKAQQQRIVSSLQAKEALAFAKEQVRGEKVFDRAVGNDAIKGIDQEHLDHVHQILHDIDYTKKDYQAPSIPLDQFVAGSDGQLAIADWIVSRERMNYKDLTVADWRALNKSIDSLMHVGRKTGIMESARGAAEIEDVARDVEKEGERFRFIDQPPKEMRTLPQRAGAAYRLISGMNMLVERIFDYHDKFNPQGPITRFVDRPFRDAYTKELRLQEKVKDQLSALEQYVDASINEPITNNYIKDPLTKQNMLMSRRMLRNFIRYMGSQSGIDKITKGFNIDPISAFNLIRENATAQDFAWANGMWKIHDSLWPEASEMERRVTGVEPDKIEARPFKMKLKDGTEVEATGGYARLNYDKARSNIQQKLAMRGGSFDQAYRTAIETPHAYVESRTNYAGYLDLSGAMDKSNIQSMIHDIAFREPVINAKKLINNEIFKNTIQTRWGVERYNLLDGWLRDVANAHNFDDTYLQGTAAWMAALRQNVTSTLIFLNPRTAIKHGGTAAFVSAAQVGPKEFLSTLKEFGIGDIMGSAKELIMSKRRTPAPDADTVQAIKDVADLTDRGKSVREFIWNSSALMRNRQGPHMDTIRGAFDRATQYGWQQTFTDIRSKSFDIGRSLVAFGDALSAMPQWYAEYKKNMAATGDHPESVFQADRAVSRAHGSNFIGDKPYILRQPNTFLGELGRWFTPLMNFWMHNFNNNMQLGWDMQARLTRGAGSEPGAYFGNMAKRFVAVAVVPLILEELVAPAVTKDEHGGWGRQMGWAVIRHIGSYFAGLREITSAWAGGYEPSVGLLGTMLRGWNDMNKDIQRYGAGKTVNQNWMVHLATALGFATGIGGSEVGRVFAPPHPRARR